MKRYDLIVIGAGPAGLSCALEAASHGVEVAVFDENERPGGQLIKQIHKFFGSKEHRAKERGFNIGREMLEEVEKAGVKVHLNAPVLGLYDAMEIQVNENGTNEHYKADSIVVAAGAQENMIPFEGWTLPGVMGAGAAQTLMNLHGVQPGKRVLMVGSGNVGLVVSFQLMQAGVEVAALVDAAPRIGGYGVHASKLARTGVPFYLPYTIVRAEGEDEVPGAVIAKVDERFQPIPGTETHIDCDTICIAVSLTPMSQLLAMVGCKTVERGGAVPVLSDTYETSIPGIFAAGDVGGIEEASSAMITGRIAGAAASAHLGYIGNEERDERIAELRRMLDELHQGLFSPRNKGRLDITETDEGIPLSMNLLEKGYLLEEDLAGFPGYASKQGVHPVIECTQNIPCNPCQDACRFGCIEVGSIITALPSVSAQGKCVDCGMCVASCPGQAIFLVDDDAGDGKASITLPYEFLPTPVAGMRGFALGRDGSELCEAEVVRVRTSPAMDRTALVTMSVPKEFAGKARFFRAGRGQ